MSDYGLKVSQPGYDVKTATAKQLVFTSGNATPLIQITGSFVWSVGQAGGGPYTQTVTHNLGYVPGFYAWVDDGTYNYNLPNGNVAGIGLRPNFYVWCSTTTLTFSTGGDAIFPTNYTIRYIMTVQSL